MTTLQAPTHHHHVMPCLNKSLLLLFNQSKGIFLTKQRMPAARQKYEKLFHTMIFDLNNFYHCRKSAKYITMAAKKHTFDNSTYAF